MLLVGLLVLLRLHRHRLHRHLLLRHLLHHLII
jgi:hypothetical protein